MPSTVRDARLKTAEYEKRAAATSDPETRRFGERLAGDGTAARTIRSRPQGFSAEGKLAGSILRFGFLLTHVVA